MPKVVLYTKDYCRFCAQAKELLNSKGAEFTEIDVTHDADLQAEMIERSGRRTVPQIFIDGRHVGGFDDLAALDAAGGLDPLLGRGRNAAEKARHYRVVILGSGPAGYTAAIYAARAGLEPALITGLEIGGQLTTTTAVENWPGGDVTLQGPELMEQLSRTCRALRRDADPRPHPGGRSVQPALPSHRGRRQSTRPTA